MFFIYFGRLLPVSPLSKIYTGGSYIIQKRVVIMQFNFTVETSPNRHFNGLCMADTRTNAPVHTLKDKSLSLSCPTGPCHDAAWRFTVISNPAWQGEKS
jgi:hypothetical protein